MKVRIKDSVFLQKLNLDEKIFEYKVYAMYMINNKLQYCLKYEEYGYTPQIVDSEYFDVIDDKLSSLWVFYNDNKNSEFALLPKQWSKYYNEHLHYFADSDFFDDNIDIICELESFHFWVQRIDAEQ